MLLRLSLAGRVAAAVALATLVTSGVGVVSVRWLEWQLALPLTALLCLPIALWLGRQATHPWTSTVKALKDGVASLEDHDFSLSIGKSANDELGELVTSYNALAGLLRRERLDLHQRELMLDTVIQTTPLALVLTNANGRIVFSNIAARQLLHGGRKLEGLDFAAVLEDAPAPLREAIAGGTDTLFTVQEGSEANVFHVSQRGFVLNAQAHKLVLLKQLTREMAAQEVAVWKKVIRVIAHELNNSLAPISSLANSGLMLARASAQSANDPAAQLPAGEPAARALSPEAARLERVFSTISDRAAHLATFIDGYARFAKLPKPRMGNVDWRQFIGRLEGAVPFRLTAPLPVDTATFDATQLAQVMINLLKNAAESGSAPDAIEVSVKGLPDAWLVEVADRGTGLNEDALRDALIPFYSTKQSGTGLGLTLCREIVEAHGGRVSIANRPGGGAVIALWLPRAMSDTTTPRQP
jgi:nitrogen fixation/metabolism regulation signal transduction histidine kinase